MPTLVPPEYPPRPDAPLYAFGVSFAEEIARSVIAAVYCPDEEQPGQEEVRAAAALTMLESFRPRDHLECMLAAQGTAFHGAILDGLHRARHPETPIAEAVKLWSSATQLGRAFSLIAHDLERRQAKPLPPRPTEAAPVPLAPPPVPPSGGTAASAFGASLSGFSASEACGSGTALSGAVLSEVASCGAASCEGWAMADDAVTRPDGTPGSLAAYAPAPPPDDVVPREAPVMMALALRPKPWRQVNLPAGEAAVVTAATPEPAEAMYPPEHFASGDALARFAAARLDPSALADAPMPAEEEETIVELELFGAPDDPEWQAERAARAAAHPEGRSATILRYGGTARRPGDGGTGER